MSDTINMGDKSKVISSEQSAKSEQSFNNFVDTHKEILDKCIFYFDYFESPRFVFSAHFENYEVYVTIKDFENLRLHNGGHSFNELNAQKCNIYKNCLFYAGCSK